MVNRQFRALALHFFTRLFTTDSPSEDSNAAAGTIQLLAILFLPGLMFSFLLLSDHAPGSMMTQAAATELERMWLRVGDRYIFVCYAMAVMGLLMTFKWDSLFPDRQDYMILTPQPISVKQLFAAKVTALAAFLSLFVVAINISSLLIVPGIYSTSSSFGSYVQAAAAHATGTVGGSVFAVLFFAALHGFLITVLPPYVFRRVSPRIQMVSMSLLVTILLITPLIYRSIPLLSQQNSPLLNYFPFIWFLGLYESLLPGGSLMPSSDIWGRTAVETTAFLALICMVAYWIGYQRYSRRILESLDARAVSVGVWNSGVRTILNRTMLRNPFQRATFYFIGTIASRSGTHQILTAMYFGVGIALVVSTLFLLDRSSTVAVPFILSTDGVLQAPIVLSFLLVTGFRVIFNVPYELGANWIFQVTSGDSSEYLKAVRKWLFLSRIVPLYVLIAFFEFALFDSRIALAHVVFDLVVTGLLIEIFFLNFSKVPFTCAYPARKLQMVLLAVGYLYAFTTYVEVMGALKRSAATDPSRMLTFLIGAGAMLAGIWLYRRYFRNVRAGIIFDEARESSLSLTADHGYWRTPHSPLAQWRFRIGLRHLFKWTWIEQLAQDFRIGSRILWKAPALSATAIILIALVIGGNTTVYAVLYAFISKPAPGVQGEGLVALVPTRNPQDFAHSYPDYRDYAAQSTTLHPLIASAPERVALSAEGGTYAYYGASVSQNYFEGLGVILAKGRSFNEIESRPGAAGLVAVISHRVWRDHFQESPDVLGRLIQVNGHSAEIIGVAPVRFRGAHLGNPEDVWVPLLSFARLMGRERLLGDRSSTSFALIGRLLPNVTLSRARAEFATISARLQNTYRDSANERGAVPVRYTGGAFTGVSDGSNVVLAVLSVVTLITLLIVSANVANLMLGRGLTRRHENAIRQSLGASRSRIVRIMLAEGFTISITAWAAACVFAYWMSKAIVGLFPDSSPGSRPNDLQIDFSPDWQVLSYAAILAVMSALMFTIAPAVRAWRLDLVSDLKAAGHGFAQRRSRLSSLLVVVQLAFSVVLLTACGLAYRSMSLLNTADPGFARDNVLLLGVNPTLGTPAGKDALLIEQLRERLGVVPGVESVSYGRLPWQRDTVAANNSPISVTVHSNYVGPDYLRVLGLRPIIGREFTLEDRGGSRGAILSQSLAEMLWPAQSPLGQTLLFGEARIPVEVIGIAPNAWYSGMGREPRPLSVFLAEQQNPARLSGDYARQEAGETTFHIRFAGDLASVSPAVVAAVKEVDPRIPVVFARTLDAQSGSAVQAMQLVLNLFMLFTGGSLLIAALGQYAVVSFNFKRRIREFGVRAAVGASSRQIARHVLKEGLVLTAMGLAAGFVLSIGVSTVLAGALYGVTPSDVITHLAVFALLSATSLIACYLPARRAARIDPVIALRHE